MKKSETLKSLVITYQQTKDKDILNRIIELNKNLINWYLENTESSLSREELYNLIIKGIIISALTYDKNNDNNIINYLSTGIRNTITHDVNHFERSRKSLFEIFLDYKRLIEKRYGVTLEKDFSIFADIIDTMIEEKVFREENRLEMERRILDILKTYHGNLELENIQEEPSTFPFEFPYDNSNLKNILELSLTKQEFEVLSRLYGLFGINKETYDEIANRFNISKSMISKIQTIALKKLKNAFDYYFSKKEIDLTKVKEFLETILTKEEYDFLLLEKGILGNDRLEQTEISKRFNTSRRYTSDTIQNAMSKITFALETPYINTNINFNMIRTYLESILNRFEFKVFCHTYGLFEFEELNAKEICDKYNLTNIDLIYEINKNIKEKIGKTFFIIFEKDDVKEFLETILTKEEYDFFTMYYGSFVVEKKFQKEIASLYKIPTNEVNNVISRCIEKFKIMIILKNNPNFDLTKLKDFLQSILNKTEFEILCYRYGLYNHDQRILKDVSSILNLSMYDVILSSILVDDKVTRYLNEDKVKRLK